MYDRLRSGTLYDRTKTSWHTFRHGCAPKFVILLIFALQQFILYYSVYFLRNEKQISNVLVLDALIVIYLILGSISTKGLSSAAISVQWCLCCTSTVLKLVPLLFSRTSSTYETASVFDRFATEDYLTFIGLYATPLVYTLFNRISNRSLFSREKENIIVDELLHSNVALSTAIDLWDLVLMTNHLIRRYRISYETTEPSPWISVEKKYFVTFGVIALTAIFMLGFIAPTVDSDLNPENGELEHRQLFWENFKNWFHVLKPRRGSKNHREEAWNHEMALERNGKAGDGRHVFRAKAVPKERYLDMFTIAKFTFLVGLFLIDLPFFVYRLLLLLRENVFSLLIYKNVLGLIIRPYRLTLSQLAERDSAKGWQSAFFEAVPVTREPGTRKVIREDPRLLDDSSESEDENAFIRKGTNRMMLQKSKSMSAGAFVRTHTRSLVNMLTSFISRSDTNTKMVKWNKKAENHDDDAMDEKAVEKNHGAPRARFLDTMNVEIESETPEITPRSIDPEEVHNDEDEEKEYIKSILFHRLKRQRDLPITTFGVFATLQKWIEILSHMFSPEPSFKMENSEFLVEERRFEFLRIVIAIFFSLASRVFIVFYCYNFANYIRPLRLVVTSDLDRITVHEWAVYLVAILGPTMQSVMFFRLQGCNFSGCLVLAIKEIVNLGSYLTCVCCMRGVVDRPYSVLYLMQLASFMLWPLGVFSNLVIQMLRRRLNLLCLMFIVCKHGIGPVTLNHKMFCLDIIKCTTISDLLLYSQWNYFTYSALFRILCCSFSPTKTGVLVILVDLLVRFLYIIFCQTMRALMLRKFEVHYLILRLTNNIKFEYQPPHETLTAPGDAANHFITHAEVDEYIRDHGLLSSPGIIFPACI